MTCPVVRVIREIRGSGLYDDDNSSNVIKLGGADNEFICDDMTFYITVRKMEFARFELSRPDYAACKQFYAKKFKNIVNIDYSQLYKRIIDDALKKKFLYRQFVDLVEIMGEIEQMVELKVIKSARKGLPINISIPDIFILPHIDQLIIYRTDILAQTMNKIIDYVNKINVNTMLSEPVISNIQHVPAFTGDVPVMTTQIPELTASNADEYITGMQSILNHEMVVANYIHSIEKYQCSVINHLNQVYIICKKIIAGLA